MTLTDLVAMMAIAIAVFAQSQAVRAVRLAKKAKAEADAKPADVELARAERITRARGAIDACKGVELSLGDHNGELPAALMLAQVRHQAAHAKADLRALGVEV